MRYRCSIDIGSSKIAACLGCFRGKQLKRIWWDSTDSVGIKRGQCQDIQGLVVSLSQLLNSLKAKSGIKIKSVYLGIVSQNIIAKHSQAVIALAERGNRSVSKTHIQHVIQQARILGSCLEDEILHAEPLSFIIDNESEVINPLGLYGHQLKVDLYLICARTSYIDKIMEVVNRVGLKINEISLSGLAVSQALFNTKKMKGINILCDIGKDITQILIFNDAGLVDYQIITSGGDDLTTSISGELDLPHSLAEEVKISYGRIQNNREVKDREIIVKKGSSYTTLSQNSVIHILTQASERITASIRDVIRTQLLRLSSPPAPIKATLYVSGRTACLDGFLEQLEVAIGMPVRMAKIGNPSISDPLMRQGILDGESTLNYLACFGLIADSTKLSYKKSTPPIRDFRSLLSYIPEKAKEIYQEYF